MRHPEWISPKNKYGYFENFLYTIELNFFLTDWNKESDVKIRAMLEEAIGAWIDEREGKWVGV